ncbi:MAG: 5'-nucleotidase C-terminal domain-containing protein [Lachnospiraceae bacterium]
MKKRRIAAGLLLVVLLVMAGCGIWKQETKDRVEITMHLWDKAMCKELTPWLEEQFPDIDFTFVVGYNTMDYYSDLNERGILPDIITCRRFSLNDASHLSDLLMDLSQTEVVGTFYDGYIENNREPGGAIRWLPMCAEVDGYIANLDLFQECGIPVPTNYAEFADACRRFEEQGIFGYLNDYREDYSCLEALQGCAIPELMTMEGILWRAKYESESEDEQVGLDDKVWPAVFEKFERYMQDTRLTPEDADRELGFVKDTFLAGKAAMMRGTASDCIVIKQNNGLNCAMLPYFGETAEDNWLLTYPNCQVAVSKAVEQDKKKTDAVLRVLEAIFSEEGQKKLTITNTVLTYNKNVHIDLNEVFAQVEDCVNRNHLYIRLASTEMFAISKEVVQKMILGEYGAQEAYEDFAVRITAVKDTVTPEIITTQQTGYEYTFGEHGSPAASAVMNTLRKQQGSDVAIGYSNLITAPVCAGNYTEQQLSWLVANRVLMRQGQLTGAELKQLLDWLVSVKEDGSNPIRHKNLIPVTSGIEYTITDNGDGTYTLGEITMNGKPLDENEVYSVLMFGDNNYIIASYYCNCPMPQELGDKMEVAKEKTASLLTAALTGGNQLEVPSDYVTILK